MIIYRSGWVVAEADGDHQKVTTDSVELSYNPTHECVSGRTSKRLSMSLSDGLSLIQKFAE